MLPIGLPSNTYDKSLVQSFRQGLRDVGIVENRDVMLDIVWSSGDLDVAVNELIQRGVELLVPCGSSASAAASRRTSTIPIVFINVGNPVGLGIVESLSHPGRNVTGFSDVLADLSGKYVELARDWAANKQRSTIFGTPNGQTGNAGTMPLSRLLNRLVQKFDHGGSKTWRAWTMPWLRSKRAARLLS